MKVDPAGFDSEGKPGLWLQNAAIFLRRWIKATRGTKSPTVVLLRKQTTDWLKQHNLEGDILREP